MTEIVALSAAEIKAEIEALTEVLWDCVEGGASVTFLKPFSRDEARAFWREVAVLVRSNGRIVLAARLDRGIVGSVQLQPAHEPNQRHRAEVLKLLVHRRARRHGVGRDLMVALEGQARAIGRSLLTLDTRAGDPAESLYRGTGYLLAGNIPRYAFSHNGTWHDAAIMYKHLT
jgi:ribosomal protein S18 acetylase RimI-like enzyme